MHGDKEQLFQEEKKKMEQLMSKQREKVGQEAFQRAVFKVEFMLLLLFTT